jgi:two-component system, cell cycle sensor histidine kinase and response regulator CckA
LHDVSAAEARLRELVQELEAIRRASLDAYMLVGEDGRLVEVNEAACAMLGYTRDELLALRVIDIEANEDRAAHEAHREQMRQRGFDRFVSRHRRKDGTVIDVEASVYFVPNSGGQFVSFVRDISERLRSEERLRLSEEEHRFVLENSSDVVYGLSPDGRFTHLSPTVEKILGWKPEEMVNRGISDFLAPGSLPTALAYVGRAVSDSLAGRTPPDFHGELEYRSKEGLPVWGEVRAFPKRRPDGSLVEFLGVARDITERKRAEEALRHTRDYLENLIDHANASIIVWDPARKITRCNAAFEAMTGYSSAEVLGRDLSMLFPAESRSESLELIAMTAAGTRWESVEIPILCKSGQVRIALWNSANVRGSDGSPLAATIAQGQDITDRKLAEEALRESERMLLLSQEIARLGSYVFDVPTNHWTSSPTLDFLFGIDSAYPREADDWLRIVHPEDREGMASYLADLLARGSRFDREYRIVDQRTGQVRWVHGMGELRRGPAGEPGRLVGTIQDITSRKVAEAEKDALQAKLALTSRLAAMGTLVAGVAHEINNPLAAEIASAGLALERLEDISNDLSEGKPLDQGRLARDVREVIDDIRDAQGASERIAQIVRDLSAFARPDTRRKRIRMAELVQQAIRWLAPTVGAQATVEVEGLDEAPDVTVSVGQIEQVLVNLITNAARATRPGERGRIVVRAGTSETGHARIDVDDQGVGIPEEIRERIFDPFFTTRPAGQERGAGLGLSICHAIVTNHGGTISLESTVGKGSTFTVELPVAPPNP